MYRIVVIIAAVISACLSAAAIAFQIIALSKWRGDDLYQGTRVTDFEALGTCVEVRPPAGRARALRAPARCARR